MITDRYISGQCPVYVLVLVSGNPLKYRVPKYKLVVTSFFSQCTIYIVR